MKLGSVFLFMVVFPISFCCEFGYLYDSPDSVTLDAGVDDDASFSCHGAGSYTYWFINDVNTEDMSLEEITRRRIHIDYLFYSQPYSGCHPQYSYLTLAGNCLNNNTQIYCVILGDMPPPLGGNTTSATANLTVIGNPTVVNSLEVFLVDTITLFIVWDVSVTTNNYSLILDITDAYNSMETITLPSLKQAYMYTLSNTYPCNVYNVILSVATNISTCSDTRNVLNAEIPTKAQNLTAKISNSTLFVQFEVSSTLCADIPNKLEVFLVDDDGRDTQSSGLILWEDIDDINGIYQFEWHVLLNDNTFYQIFIISHSILGQAISEPFILSTYDTQELDYTLNESELCLTCTFILHSTVKGCTVSILLSSTLYHVILQIPKANNSAEECLTLSENGTYQISVYDWEKDGLISVKPAVVERIVVNEVPSTSGIIKNVTSQSLDLTTTSLPTSENTPSSEQNKLTVAFGSLFALAMLFLLIIITLWMILIIRKKLYLKYQKHNEQRMSISTNAAYGTAKFSSDVNIQQPISQPTTQSQTGDGAHTYEMVTVNVSPSSELYDNVNF